MQTKANKELYRIRRLPLRAPRAELSPVVMEELRLLCAGQWEFLETELIERRWADEDQATALRPELGRAWAKFAVSSRLAWATAVREFEYALAAAFDRASGQHQRWASARAIYRRVASFCDRGGLNRLLIRKPQYGTRGEAFQA